MLLRLSIALIDVLSHVLSHTHALQALAARALAYKDTTVQYKNPRALSVTCNVGIDAPRLYEEDLLTPDAATVITFMF